MRIAIITPQIEGPGGSSRYAQDLGRALRGRGVDCDVLPVRGPSPWALWTVWKAIKGYDLVHAIDPVPVGIWACFAAKLRGLPFVMSAQGTYAVAPLYNLKTAFLAKLSYEFADTVVAISRYTRDEVLRKVPRARVLVINHGVWVDEFAAPARAQAVSPRILSVGRIKRRKGYHVALEGVALFRKTHPDAHYLIIGAFDSPGYAQELRTRAACPDLAGAVDFKERVGNGELAELYRTSDIFLLPSINEGHHFEGFGLVFLEAAAAGLPSVGTTGNGIEDAVTDGGTGVLVPQENPEAIARALTHVWNAWNTMSAAARAFAQMRDWHTVSEAYETLYIRLLKTPIEQ